MATSSTKNLMEVPPSTSGTGSASSLQCSGKRFALFSVIAGVIVLVVLLSVFFTRGGSGSADDENNNQNGDPTDGISPFGLSSSASGPTPNVSAALVPFVSSGLSEPWGFTFLPDRRLLVVQKGGLLRLVNTTGSVVRTIAGTPTVYSEGQGGLLDVALDPDFSTNRLLYLAYAERGTGEESSLQGTAVMRARWASNETTLESQTVIFRQFPKVSGTGHYGARIIPHKESGTTLLYVTLGERQDGSRAQLVINHFGKVVRITTDGSPAPGNPDFGNGSQPHLYTIGHRNPQAAVLHPTTNVLWVAEHGPQGGDEVNVIAPGKNYGWAAVSYGCNYGDPQGAACRIGGTQGVHNAPYTPPVVYWQPTSVAPGGMAFYNAGAIPSPKAIPEWNGNLFVGGLTGRSLYRFQLNGTQAQVLSYERLFNSAHEVRDVKLGPDGLLYIASRNTQQIYRVERA